jgi:hypothetical protein
MRGFAVTSSSILLSIALSQSAIAEGVPDLGPMNCAWDKLAPDEQGRLREEFKVEMVSGFTLHFATPNPAATAAAASACQLSLSPQQMEHLGLALGRRAAEEKARKGISDLGEKPDSIQVVLDKMNAGKREVIGNAFGCPGAHSNVGEWDESVRGAVRRANLRFKNERAYPWVSLGLYSAMAKEGAVRRMNGQAGAC